LKLFGVGCIADRIVHSNLEQLVVMLVVFTVPVSYFVILPLTSVEKDEVSRFFQNVYSYLPNCTVTHF